MSGVAAGQRALVTGASGFAGRHLVRLLVSEGLDVFGVTRRADHAGLPDDVTPVSADLADRALVRALLDELRPRYVFHLAGHTSEGELDALLVANVLLTDHLLEAASRLLTHQPVSVFVSGSAAEYGLITREELPIVEEQPLRPLSAYGVSKAAQVTLALKYYRAEGVPVYVGRVFNLIGPGEPPTLVCSTLARQVVAVERGVQSSIRVGSLDARRDFVDVRDAASAFWHIVRGGRAGETYNVCSGRATSVAAVLDWLLAETDRAPAVEQDPGRLRTNDVPSVIGDNRKLRRETCWTPRLHPQQSLRDLLEHWRQAETDWVWPAEAQSIDGRSRAGG